MREINFRAWDRLSQEMNYDDFDMPVMEFNEGIRDMQRERYTLMQFTGLHDKNGKEIYEGDIVSFNGNMTADNTFGIEPNGYIYDENSIHAVMWNEKLAAWDLNFKEDDEWKYKRDTRGLMIDGDCEVIGNVFQNKELLNDLK